MNSFAADVKLLRKIESKEDCEYLQKDLHKIHIWSKFWEMPNAKKYKVLEISCSSIRQSGKYSMGYEWIKKTYVENHLRVGMVYK